MTCLALLASAGCTTPLATTDSAEVSESGTDSAVFVCPSNGELDLAPTLPTAVSCADDGDPASAGVQICVRVLSSDLPPGPFDLVVDDAVAGSGFLDAGGLGQACTTLNAGAHTILARYCTFETPGAAITVADCPARTLGTRPRAPGSTAIVGTRRPALQWTLGPGADAARLELCADRACSVVSMSVDVAGTAFLPTADLPTGPTFWRVSGLAAGGLLPGDAGPTWQVHVAAGGSGMDGVVGWVGDVTGDGFADVPLLSNGTDGPRLDVFPGGPTGVSAAPLYAVDFATHRWASSEPNGYTVAFAGDVDGDGFGDVVVGRQNNVMAALVYRGGVDGLQPEPLRLVVPDPYGEGATVASGAGDVDADGFADVLLALVTGSGDAPGGLVYRGAPTGFASGNTFGWKCGVPCFGPVTELPLRSFPRGAGVADVDVDGFADVMFTDFSGGGYANGAAYFHRGSTVGTETAPATSIFNPDSMLAAFGFAVAGAGDVDADGYPDVVIGAPDWFSGGPGRIHLHLGGLTGPSTAPDQTVTAPAFSPSEFGTAVAGVGDVDGDAFHDVVVAPAWPSEPYLFLGSPTGLATPAAVTFGVLSDDIAGVGDTDGDALADVVLRDAGVAYVFSGVAGGVPDPAPSATLVPPVTPVERESESCASALVLPPEGVTVSFSLSDALRNHAPLSCAGATEGGDRAFAWTPAASGMATFEASGADTLLAVFSSSSCTAAVEIACDDDSGSLPFGSRVSLAVSAGATYWVVVAHKWLNAPVGRFALAVAAP